MSIILRFIKNMLPYMILTAPILLIFRIIINKKNKSKVNFYRETGLFLFALFIVGLASQAILPKLRFGLKGFIPVENNIKNANLIPFKVLFDTYKEVFINKNINNFIINFLGNIIIFMPIGFFIPLLWNIEDKKVILIGFCSSLFIETSQLFLKRCSDVDDLILNTLGVFLGLFVFKILNKKLNKFFIKFR